MSRYGKALSVYKRINNIKRATENINNARLDINRQQLEARRTAQDVAMENDIISGAINWGSQFAAGALHQGNLISSKEAQWGSAIAGALGTGATQYFNSNRDDLAGLSAEEAQATGMSLTDAMNQGLTNYNIQDMLSESKFRNERDEFLESNNGRVFESVELNENMSTYNDDYLQRVINGEHSNSPEFIEAAQKELRARNLDRISDRSFAQRDTYLDQAEDYGEFRRREGYVFDGFDEEVIKDRMNSYIDSGKIDAPDEDLNHYERLRKIAETITSTRI